MEIAAGLAQSIVISMKEIINQELNFINIDGIILASTDDSRIGEHHAGAKRVIETKSDLIVEYDGQYEGTKKGINIPIYSDQHLVGVIGITGNKDEVEKYGKIIKTMTEILVKDAWIKDVSFKKRDNYRILIEELLAPTFDLENIQTLANVLEINLNIPRIVVVGRIKNLSVERNEQIENVMNLLKVILTNDNQTIYNVNGQDIRILFRDNLQESALHYQLNSLIRQAEQQYGLQLYIGVGLVCDKLTGFRTSFERAVTALDWAILNSHNTIEYYSKLDLGMILTDISKNKSDEFIDQILGKLDKKELDEYAEILPIYGTNNGSIYKAADELFIHKNTLQYKLNKLHKVTGYNPRELDDYAILSLAFKLQNILNSR
ncbi:CdaR family transcriptional regulator [Trichococcus alkaliphilus]|uniref:CdaR family transcriptional regulator n=1 Tax=Trichococcus alkaliphilus TaxID=2052943 RepID=UPI000D0B3946|nr:sugar diacid recognition domain-containing protein [Trichococcus alkaliphilus]